MQKSRLILVAITDGLFDSWTKYCGGLDGVEVYRGNIFDLDCDAIVSPANSFGFMDGGIDALYTAILGEEVGKRVRDVIEYQFRGELLIGQAINVDTDYRIPHLIAAPTMRVPCRLPSNTVNPYLAARAVFLHMEQFPNWRVAMPGLGTGTGGVHPDICAHQVATAWREVMENSFVSPKTLHDACLADRLLFDPTFVLEQ